MKLARLTGAVAPSMEDDDDDDEDEDEDDDDRGQEVSKELLRSSSRRLMHVEAVAKTVGIGDHDEEAAEEGVVVVGRANVVKEGEEGKDTENANIKDGEVAKDGQGETGDSLRRNQISIDALAGDWVRVRAGSELRWFMVTPEAHLRPGLLQRAVRGEGDPSKVLVGDVAWFRRHTAHFLRRQSSQRLKLTPSWYVANPGQSRRTNRDSPRFVLAAVPSSQEEEEGGGEDDVEAFDEGEDGDFLAPLEHAAADGASEFQHRNPSHES
jgi:hypothetical protein